MARITEEKPLLRSVFRGSARLIIFHIILFLSAPVFAEISFAVIPESPRPGEPVTIAVGAAAGVTSGLKQAALMVNGRTLARAAFFLIPAEDETAPLMAAVLAVPATAKPGAAMIRIESPAGLVSELPLQIGERTFVSEVIELNAALTGIRTEPDPQKTAEANRLWGIINATGSEIYWHGHFTPPVASQRRTSFFGDRRVFKYANGKSDTSIHAGVDYGVPTGTPVAACGAGKVVLARFRIVTGNSVIIEHLPGVYSLYYHLDSIGVTEGALVAAGTLLGKSGATGLATGPHLHWEIRVSGENADPDAFVTRPVLDKAAILGTIMKE